MRDYRRTVPETDPRLQRLLDELDDRTRGRLPADRLALWQRGDREFELCITLTHPGGGGGRFLVTSRCVLPRNVSFLHAGYLHPGTKCGFEVEVEGRMQSVASGAVAWCEFLERGIHAVGVEFDCSVDPSLFVRSRGGRQGDRVSLRLPELRGTVLVLDDQRLDRELVRFHLRSTGLELMGAATAEEALEIVAQRPVDVVVCDLNLESGRTGEEAIARLTDAGWTGPVILLTAESDDGRVGEAMSAGAFTVVRKPYDRRSLMAALVASFIKRDVERKGPSVCEVGGAASAGNMIRSTLELSSETDRMVSSFVAEAHRMAEELRGASAMGDVGRAREVCRTLTGSAAGYGFAPLSAAASHATRELAGGDLSAARAALDAVLAIIGRLAAPAGAQTAAAAAR